MAVHRIGRAQCTYRFSSDVVPVLEISPGDRVTAETWDASTGRIRKSEDVHSYLKVRDRRKVNPAAGPIFVKGAHPGTSLVVTIERIQLAELGFVRATVGAGLLQQGRDRNRAVMVRLDGDELVFTEGLRIPVRPMIGVIGTAPAEGVVYTAEPSRLGSNLDINAVKVGAKVHLPVEVEGALLAVGDVHASMGDGEVSGTGVEISAEVTFTVELEDRRTWPRIWIETDDAWVTTGHAPTVDGAIRSAVEDMVRMLSDRLELGNEEAFMLFSMAGDARVGQAAFCGIDATAYASFAKIEVQPLGNHPALRRSQGRS